MNRQKYRNKWLRWHASYEKRALKLLRKVFKDQVDKINWDAMTSINYQSIIKEAISYDELYAGLFEIHKEIGLKHGSRVVVGVNQELKQISFLSFSTYFLESLQKYFQRYGVSRVRTIEQTFFNTIVDLMTNRFEKEEDFNTTVRQIEKLVNRPDFYKWQAARIVRTESTGAANNAAMIAGDSSMFEMQKEWVSRTDSKTRRHPEDPYDHLEQDGQVVRLHDWFEFDSDDLDHPDSRLLYPGYQPAPAANVINCRCSIAVSPIRDQDGNLIRKGELPEVAPPAVSPMTVFESTIRHQDYESAALFDAEGNEVFRKDGSRSKVSFTGLEIIKMIRTNRLGVLTHNHPRSSSFSEADILLLLKQRLGAIRAVNRSGGGYEMRVLDPDYIFTMNEQKSFDHEYGKAWTQAEKLTDAWLSDFWVPGEGYPQSALDGANKMIVEKTWEYLTTFTRFKDILKYIVL